MLNNWKTDLHNHVWIILRTKTFSDTVSHFLSMRNTLNYRKMFLEDWKHFERQLLVLNRKHCPEKSFVKFFFFLVFLHTKTYVKLFPSRSLLFDCSLFSIFLKYLTTGGGFLQHFVRKCCESCSWIRFRCRGFVGFAKQKKN